MKTTNQFFTAICMMLLLCSTIQVSAQEEQTAPVYITVTTMHWNMDMEDFDMDTWKSVEKEYLDKVIAKNDYVMSSSFYLHNLTPDNTELVYVRSYGSWEDIEKASIRDSELEKEAWPDEAERKAFLKKQRAYYSNEHSDEIYSTMTALSKPLEDNSKDMVCYVRKSHLAFPENGDNEELRKLYTEYITATVKDNPLVKAFYPHRHAWGADGTEIMEAVFVDSLADLDKVFDSRQELIEKAWPDEATRKANIEAMSKYFTGVHGDYVYSFVAGLSK
ncbi:hypothetical protein KO566_07990 [Flavobacteriaceae bacterium XHP0103]|uniref:hypothetical protein n=1 Tax=Marixanthotalea marina TaxID=2844359 RepID=UPI00298A0539|nr:hypothetical protein [Marixanthotalea marina]MBU3821997.1 hypothetical protein [Marixanthotalea marina]